MSSEEWIDLSHPFELGMPVPDWPNEIRQEFVLLEFRVKVNSGIQNLVIFNLHCGTHIDAPKHYCPTCPSIDQLDISTFIGEAYVADIPKKPLEKITREDLEKVIKYVKPGDMLFIRTGWEEKWPSKEYESMYPYFSPDVVDLIVNSGIKVLGIDTPGPDAPIRSGERKGDPLHIGILSRGIPIIENLTNLKKVLGKRIFVIAVPINIKNATGAPVRVLAKIIR